MIESVRIRQSKFKTGDLVLCIGDLRYSDVNGNEYSLKNKKVSISSTNNLAQIYGLEYHNGKDYINILIDWNLEDNLEFHPIMKSKVGRILYDRRTDGSSTD